MFLAQYWAEQLAEQNEDAELKAKFTVVAEQLKENQGKNSERNCCRRR